MQSVANPSVLLTRVLLLTASLRALKCDCKFTARRPLVVPRAISGRHQNATGSHWQSCAPRRRAPPWANVVSIPLAGIPRRAYHSKSRTITISPAVGCARARRSAASGQRLSGALTRPLARAQDARPLATRQLRCSCAAGPVRVTSALSVRPDRPCHFCECLLPLLHLQPRTHERAAAAKCTGLI